MDPVNVAQVAGTAVAHDLSIIRLFLNADWVVKSVMIALLLASFWSWAVIFDKLIRLRRVRGQAERFEEIFWSGGSIDDLYDKIGNAPRHPMDLIFVAAMREWRRSTAKGLRADASLLQRINQVMQITVDREMERLEKYIGFLATVGSTAPFIGLLGTVWGIMNSFQAIGATKNTSLAVVAPGIAEALFATAVGLIAAIQAVVAYNKFSTDLGRYASRLEGFAGEFSAMLSRKIDERT